jgi:hypothetical protein
MVDMSVREYVCKSFAHTRKLPRGFKKRQGRLSGIADEPSSQGLSLNRSQHDDCSTKYNTPAGT